MPSTTTITISIDQLASIQDVLRHGSESPSAASWACGAVYTAIEILKGELEK